MSKEHEPQLLSLGDTPIVRIGHPRTKGQVVQSCYLIEEERVVQIISLSVYPSGYVLVGDAEDGEPEKIIVRSLEDGGEEVDGLSGGHPVGGPGLVVSLDPVVVGISDSSGQLTRLYCISTVES
jgi:hypothetical protein